MRMHNEQIPEGSADLPFIYDDQQVLIFNTEDAEARNLAQVHNIGDQAKDLKKFKLGNNKMQFKNILYTDYDEILILAFCDRLNEESQGITKLINIYTRGNPEEMSKGEKQVYIELMLKHAEHFGADESEIALLM